MILHAERLVGVKPELVMVVIEAGNHMDFQVQQGLRTLAQQREYVAAGKSQTMNSRHLTGDAVDLTVLHGGVPVWDWSLYEQLAGIVKSIARKQGVAITWGGDWKTLKDGPHFELTREVTA